jgi:actin-related protein 2
MVSVDRAKDLRLAAETRYFEEQYVLPDGGAVYLGQEKFSATEALFDPLLVGSDSPGVTDLVYNVIQETDLNLRSEFYRNILLTGANTMFPGLRARLDHELQAKYVDSILKGDKGRYQPGKICVHGPPHRSSSVFIGACVLAEATAAVNESWVTKQEYEDLGAGRCVAKICKA